MQRELSIDIETYSELTLMDVGAHRYVEHPSFEVLLFAYAFDDEPVKIVDLANFEEVPQDIFEAVINPNITNTAWNASFERTCLAKHFGTAMVPEQWSCTMVRSYYNGLPGSLDLVGKALKLDTVKDKEGKALIRYFCVPCKPTKKNGGRTRNYPHHDPEKWERFKEYCKQDVRVERKARKLMRPLPAPEQKLWCLDQHANDKGIRVEMALVDQAVRLYDDFTDRLKVHAKKLTGLENPNSIPQMKGWLTKQLGLEEPPKSMDKAFVKDALEKGVPMLVKRVLKIRQELGKTSCKKFHLLQVATCDDGMIRGVIQFYGANRTGRDAGRLLQVQNLAKNALKDLDGARRLVMKGLFETFEILYDDVLSTLSQLIRTTLIADEGYTWLVGDFSAIEARVIAWMADEEWRMEVFRTHGKIYEASASTMFKIPFEQISKGSKERQKGKVAELACGYGGGKGALKAMDPKWAETQTDAELQDIIYAWRDASPNIVRLWRQMEDSAMQAIRTKGLVPVKHGVAFIYRSGHLYLRFPSGRETCYRNAKIEPMEKFGRVSDTITFWGTEQGRWMKQDTYGGKLTENLIQGIARDCLMVAFNRLTHAGFDIRFRVHDELVANGLAEDEARMREIMGQPIKWAEGLPLPADTYTSDYYMKD